MTAPTRQQVEAEGAGPKLDSLVAKHGMGCMVHRENLISGELWYCQCKSRPHADEGTHLIKEYSTSGSAMLEVVEKLILGGHYVELHAFKGECRCLIGDDVVTLAETLPLAAARAFVLAVIGGE